MSRFPLEVLAQVIRLGRDVLDDLEPAEVPHSMHKVRAKTGRTLPKPYANLLLDELDSNEWFRGRVAERFTGEVDSDDNQEAAAALFLFRPQGWEESLEHRKDRAAKDAQSHLLKQAQKDKVQIQQELRFSQEKAKRLRKELEQSGAEHRTQIEEAQAAAYLERDAHLAKIRQLEKQVRTLNDQLASQKADLSESKRQADTAREELLQERRHKLEAESAQDLNPWGQMSVRESAELLDEVVEAFSPPREFAVEDWKRSSQDQPTLPPLPVGVAPDSKQAIEWLLERSEPYVLLLDGYNVMFKLEGWTTENHDNADLPKGRTRLEKVLARFVRLASGTPKVLVVYDSREKGDGSSYRPARRIEVRFSAEGRIADDELLDLAADLGSRAVMVSSDREVREGAQSMGAMGLWSEAMVAWNPVTDSHPRKEPDAQSQFPPEI